MTMIGPNHKSIANSVIISAYNTIPIFEIGSNERAETATYFHTTDDVALARYPVLSSRQRGMQHNSYLVINERAHSTGLWREVQGCFTKL